MPVTTSESLLTLAAASERFNVSISTLRAWRRRRLITRYSRRDGVVVVDANEIQQLQESRSEIIREDDQEADGN